MFKLACIGKPRTMVNKRVAKIVDNVSFTLVEFVSEIAILYHGLTCLGHLGWRNTDRIVSIYVVPPKVAKASTITCRCRQLFRLQMSPSPALSHNRRQFKHGLS